MLVVLACRDSKGRISLRPAVDRPGFTHRHLRMETDWVTEPQWWENGAFCRLRGFILDLGGLGVCCSTILSTEILDKTRSPLARDKINGKFRPAPPKKTIKDEKMVRFALCTASSSIWGGGGLGFAVPFCVWDWGLTLLTSTLILITIVNLWNLSLVTVLWPLLWIETK